MTNHSLKVDMKKPTLKAELIEMYMKVASSFYYEGSDEETEREIYAPEFAEAIIAKCLEHLPEKKSRSKDLADIEKHQLFQFDDNPRMRRLIAIGHINAHNELLDQITSEWSK